MEDLEIQLEETGHKGRAFISDGSKTLAEMTYSKAGEALIIIDHAEVSDQLRGQGAGKSLLVALVNMARYRAIKIMPLCPFAKSVFNKDHSLRDVLKEGMAFQST